MNEATAAPMDHLIDYSQVLLILLNETGHDFSEYKKRTVGRRVENRMRQHGLNDPSIYANFLRNNPVEIQKLLSELLINVTCFFRDPAAFESLVEHAFPIILQVKNNHQVIRIWDVGCATGEEAYTIAILLREYMDRTKHEFNIRFYATDLNQDSIKTARLGRYPTSIRNHVSSERLAKFFLLEKNGFRINKTIRNMVIFSAHNVLNDPPLLKLNLLCCRNVLIYHEAALQSRLIQKFNFALRDGAILLLALNESIGNHANLFRVLEQKFKIYQANKFIEPSVFCGPPPLAQTTDRTQTLSIYSNTTIKKSQLMIDQDIQHIDQDLQAVNEQLQSVNEELETSQEQLQSVNEELNTVNAELQVNINQLAIMQSDIKNLLDNMKVGTIFLDRNFIIRRFTREAVHCFRLIESDIGRSIEDIRSNFIESNLLGMVRQVIDSNESLENELLSNSGVWYLVHIQPYQTLEGTPNGAVLTFTDITKRVVAEEATTFAKTLAEGIIDSVLEPLVVLDAQLNVLYASRSFFTFFKVTPEETLGRHIYDLGNKQWDISALRELLETILPLKQNFEGYLVEHQFQDIGFKKMLLNARRIVDSNGNTQLILFAMQEM
jgi:two-component system CheB/CheR fusion protein